MKIIIPIAGIGSRLRPFTLSKPKAFIRVAGKTVLDHILDYFSYTFDSDTELILIVGYKKRQIIEYIKKKYSNKFNLTFVEQIPRGYKDNTPYYWGLGEAIYLASERFLENYDSISEDKTNGALIFLSDSILMDDLSFVLNNYYKKEVDGIIGIMRVPKEEANSYGVVRLDENGFIQQLIEKPKIFVSNAAIAGIYIFSNNAMKSLFNHLKTYLDKRSEGSKEIYLTESMQNLVDDGFKILGLDLQKGMLDFGRPSEVINSNKILLKHANVNHENFDELRISMVNSAINGPVYIEGDAKIEKSVIGPNVSIGKNVKIETCIIQNSIIDKDVELKNIITRDSIIGSNVRIENISKDFLIIGDKSKFL